MSTSCGPFATTRAAIVASVSSYGRRPSDRSPDQSLRKQTPLANEVSDIADLVDRIRRHYDDGCFACGRDNPIGLHLDDFTLDDDGEVSARFTPRKDYRGAGTTVHGGVAATALDEMLVWAGLLNEKVLTVTGKLELRYRKPLHVHEVVVATARVDEFSGRRMTASGELTVDDEMRAQASGLFLVSADLAEMGVL